MKFLGRTFNLQPSTLNLEPSGRVPIQIIEGWALKVEGSMFHQTFQP
jgi:hypothetical protein